MSKFLTPPVWYDSNGNLVEILAKAKSSEGVGVGPESTIPGAGVGVDANAGYASVAIGTEASANRLSVAIGHEAKDSSSGGGISIGASSTVAGKYSVSIGYGSATPDSYSISIGAGATATAQRSVAIGSPLIDSNGEKPTTAVADAIAIGSGASAAAFGCIAIGVGTTSKTSGSEHNLAGAIVIGHGSKVYGDGSIAIGNGITLGTDESRIDPTIQIGGPKLSYTFQVGNINVFNAINEAARTFYINAAGYTARYDPASGTLNFVTE